jgi:hypothetical protein
MNKDYVALFIGGMAVGIALYGLLVEWVMAWPVTW